MQRGKVQQGLPQRNPWKIILLTVIGCLIFLFLIVPLLFTLVLSDGARLIGNVAVIPIEGPISGDGAKSLGTATVSSQEMVGFIEEAGEDPSIQALVLEINSPGGSAVASDEVAAAVKKVQKPVIALIREMGASGGYWIASATDYIIANKMSITGSIGVISSYLEFTGFMEKYGFGYERLVSGKFKDVGTPFQKLDDQGKNLLQRKLDTVHDFFIQEIAANRNLSEEHVRALATGEFFLGVEALQLGLVDELGDKETVEQYLKEVYGLEEINYVRYESKPGFFQLLSGVFSQFSFEMGRGIAALFLEQELSPWRIS